jgi:hypothetical protein
MRQDPSEELIAVLQEVRALLARPDNDYAWSSWPGPESALTEIDGLVARIKQGASPSRLDLEVLFAPTGPIQEVSVSSGWGQRFLELENRFDAAMNRFCARWPLFGHGGLHSIRPSPKRAVANSP